MKHKFLFSVVMAVYKVEEYLEEAIESLVNQTLDFEKHVQLILVNDGSPDNSEEICLRYKEKYPNNIVYVKQKNSGVSSARNAGIEKSEGKYVNFLDSDDRLSPDALYKVFAFFEQNYDLIDFVSLPLHFFEGAQGEHVLNYKFEQTQIVDVLENYDHIQMHISSSFVKREALQGRRFNENLAYSEDADVLNKILIDKFKFGVISDAQYHYRRRLDNSSAVQTGSQKKEWFIKCLTEFAMGTIRHCQDKLGYLPKYFQFMIMYDLQWRFNIDKIKDSILEEEDKVELFATLKQVLSYVDDKIILEQRHLNEYRKVFALELKYNKKTKEMFDMYFLKDDVLLYYKNFLINSLKKQIATIEFIEIKKNKIYLEGNFRSSFDREDYKIIIKKDDENYATQSVDRPINSIYSWGELIKEVHGFKATIPLERMNQKQELSVVIKIDNCEVPIEKLKYGRFTRLATRWQKFYYSYDNFILRRKANKLVVESNTFLNKVKKELKLLKSFYKQNKTGSRKAIFARLMYYLIKPFKPNPIWLFVDRHDKADDNAEHLYKYALEKKDGIKKYFIIKKGCKDYARLKKQYKTIIPFGTYKHKFLYLLANKVISSHADEWVINPFFKLRKYYVDIMNFDFVFIQHGIIQNDLSHWLNKWNKNINFFVTSTKSEYNHIRSAKYGYDENVVKLTGLPRFDNLINKDKKQILIMPTWRRAIVGELNQKEGKRPYNPFFKETMYFKVYNALINDKRLLEKATEKGYKIIFFPHPNIQQQIKDFDRNEKVQFNNFHQTSYQKLFNESSLLITDFSSVAFDFAYLKKPLIYYQEIPNHLEFGYFDYESMGFGEVVYDYDLLINLILEYIEKDCQIKNEYIKRIEDFYAFTDRNNCQRVYDAILQLEK